MPLTFLSFFNRYSTIAKQCHCLLLHLVNTLNKPFGVETVLSAI